MEVTEMKTFPMPEKFIIDKLRYGIVIPAHPLALTNDRKFDENHQRAITRYYYDAGVGGIAIGVHTTQFEIRLPKHGLFQPVLEFEAETINECERKGDRKLVRVAGVIGKTSQAVVEASIVKKLGYHLALLSLASLKDASDQELLAHCRSVAEIIPIMGFYLQPAAGGRLLSYNFWRKLSEIPNLVGIKIAPFNRFQTLDVVRAVADSGRLDDIVLYTGNDDHIIMDLIGKYEFNSSQGKLHAEIAGGLLGHWACWTRRAVEQLDRCRLVRQQENYPSQLMTLANQVTDCNAAFFDAANGFAGCIPGIHEVLRRQGLMANNYTLNPSERLSLGQLEEVDRVYRDYPELNDDDFVSQNLDKWLS